MKKIITICITLVMVISLAVPAFAYTDTGEVEVTAHIYSVYDITIPATIDASMGTAEVSVTGQIEDNYKVEVFVMNATENGGVPLTHTNGTDQLVCFFKNIELGANASDTVPLVTFYATEFVGTDTRVKSFNMEIMAIGKPGIYSGTMVYAFDCRPCE